MEGWIQSHTWEAAGTHVMEEETGVNQLSALAKDNHASGRWSHWYRNESQRAVWPLH